MIKAFLFDLDGTLLPMDTDEFTKAYVGNLAKRMKVHGMDPQKVALGLMEGVKVMVKNDGLKTNEERFWDNFDKINGINHELYTPYFDEFYERHFVEAKSTCGYNPWSKEVIRILKEKGYRLILATNPLFPKAATYQRVEWAGLNVDDFEWITTFENCSTCKPNPNYYKVVLAHCGLNADEAIMVGNDVQEDLIAKTLGMKVCMINDTLLNRKNEPFEADFIGSMEEFKSYIEKEF